MLLSGYYLLPFLNVFVGVNHITFHTIYNFILLLSFSFIFPDLLVIKSIYWRILTGFCFKFGYHLLFYTCVEPFPSLLPTFQTTIETCYTQFIEFPIKLSKLNSLGLFQWSASLDLHFKCRFFLSNRKFSNNFPPKTVIYIKKDTSKII